MKLLLALAACGVAFLAARPAKACSCAAPPPPCERFWETEAVFSGKVTAVKAGPDASIIATIQLDEKFRGPLFSKTVNVSGGGMCGTEFAVGEQYFVYANDGGNGQLHSSLCGRTRRIGDATDDLAYAHSIPNRTLAVVQGKVQIEDETGTTKDRAGATVIVPNTKIAAKTDANGQYTFQIAPGKYTLDVVDPGTKVRWGRLETVEIPNAAACARRDITIVYNGRIRGTLTDHTGKPTPNITLTAHAVGTRQSWRLDGQTDASGHYEISGVPKGNYRIAVGTIDDGGPGPEQPYATTYYPGVSSEALATSVTVPRSGLVTKIDFKLPPPLAVYKVTGILRSQGKPLANQHINFRTKIQVIYGHSTGAKTDATGRFTFKDVAGAEVSLEVCRPDAGPANYKTACKIVEHKLDKDWTIDLDYPQ
ncbi:MAG: carboxypeptidase regulatory-like domain-containing protein [Kofleriaceae bacterium]